MTLETKGKSKITAKEVIAARKLKVSNPEMSMQAIKDKLGLAIHVIMVGRAIRGITHGHLDMCGLPVRPMEHRTETDVRTGQSKPLAKKAKKAKRIHGIVVKPGSAYVAAKPAKKAAKPAGKPRVRKPKTAKVEATAAA
jgi:hypothetical protein